MISLIYLIKTHSIKWGKDPNFSTIGRKIKILLIYLLIWAVGCFDTFWIESERVVDLSGGRPWGGQGCRGHFLSLEQRCSSNHHLRQTPTSPTPLGLKIACWLARGPRPVLGPAAGIAIYIAKSAGNTLLLLLLILRLQPPASLSKTTLYGDRFHMERRRPCYPPAHSPPFLPQGLIDVEIEAFVKIQHFQN